MPTQLVLELAQLDTCCVSDALDRLGLPGSISGIGCLTGRHSVAGRVVTVELGPPKTVSSPGSHLGTAAIEAAGHGDVIVVDHQGRDDCAAWGGKLSRAAHVKGLSGTIVFGAARDVDEAHEIGYPLFATAATPRTARGRAVERSWGGPIHVGDVVVAQGDLVVADSSGVVFVPADHADAVVAAARDIAATEARLAADIARGAPVSTVMGTGYETMLSGTETADPS